VLPRLVLLALVIFAVVTMVEKMRERRRLEREGRPSVEQRLADLDELLRREVITRQEYDVARLRIITNPEG
jgi:large-conductance mechanosensitive channel